MPEDVTRLYSTQTIIGSGRPHFENFFGRSIYRIGEASAFDSERCVSVNNSKQKNQLKLNAKENCRNGCITFWLTKDFIAHCFKWDIITPVTHTTTAKTHPTDISIFACYIRFEKILTTALASCKQLASMADTQQFTQKLRQLPMEMSLLPANRSLYVFCCSEICGRHIFIKRTSVFEAHKSGKNEQFPAGRPFDNHGTLSILLGNSNMFHFVDSWPRPIRS